MILKGVCDPQILTEGDFLEEFLIKLQNVLFWAFKCTFCVFSDHLCDFGGPFSGRGGG